MIAMLGSFGFDVTALVAGLGVGGIAIALGAQKTLENVFGGITLFANQPVRVGDVCRFGEKLGIVEEIGLYSTRVRTLERTVVTVPNSEFASLQLENFGVRDKMLYNPTLGLRYETTPEQLRYVLVEVRKMLYAHPKVDPDPARIRFKSFGAYSLDLEIFTYVKSTDINDFLEVAEDLNLRIMDLVAAAGTSFAFPSQTMYFEQGEGIDRDAAREAEKAVQLWRERRELNLPRFPPERIAELRGKIDYPPEGSPFSAAIPAGRDGAGKTTG
jgi:MscS family membrane protein